MSYETLPHAEQVAMNWLKEHGGKCFYGRSGMNAVGTVNFRISPKTWLFLIQKGYIVATTAQAFEMTDKR